MNESLPYLRKKAMSLPLTPGVYIMKNKSGEIIYIGKAKALKNRVSSYFGSQNNHSVKVFKMVSHVQDFDYILTDSEFEALVLECSLIKQHKPKYNILLKDDKGYNYIKVTNGEWRGISACHQKLDDGADYIGPYTGSFSVTNAVDEARKIFRLPSCSKVFPRDLGKGRPCLNFFIGQCSAPCSGKITRQAHNEAVGQAVDFITGGSAASIRDLTDRMLEASEKLEFEKAARLRDRINAIRKISEKQKVVSASVPQQDVFALVFADASQGAKACMSVLRFSEGRLYDSEYFIIDADDDAAHMRSELVQQYYSIRSFVPKRVTLDAQAADMPLLAQWLTSKRGSKVTITVPVRGEQHSLTEMCRSNAAQKLALSLGKTGRATAVLDELASALSLPKPPQYIESYDISHTAGSDNVAGMVVFKDGAPYKKAYRRFAIKGFTGQDDYASMAQVVERRLLRYFEEKGSGEGFGRLPDLILLDGGKGQVNAVKPVLDRYGLDIPLFGMVKDSRHRTRAIATGGGEIAISSKRAVFTLVSQIQDEVHRFSVEYHRKRHKKSSLTSTLTDIEGIGPSRAGALLKRFKSMTAIADASEDELAAVKGMTASAAKAVYTAFHPENDSQT